MELGDSFKTLIEKGVENADPEYLKRARTVLETMLLSAPGEERLYFYVGVILGGQGEWREAGDNFKKALELNPDCSEYMLWHKRAKKESGRSPLSRCRSRLRLICFQIGEELVQSNVEFSAGDLQNKSLQEKIDLAGKLRKEIDSILSSPEKEISVSEPKQKADKIPPPSVSLDEPLSQTCSYPPLPSDKKDKKITGAKKNLLNVKKELESLHQLLSARTRPSAVEQTIPVAPKEKSNEPVIEGDKVYPDKHLYRRELDVMEASEKLEIFQLINELDSCDQEVREMAVYRLGEKNLSMVNPILLKRWLVEPVSEIQLKIISILVSKNYTPLIAAARKVLQEDRTDSALSALDALYRLQGKANISFIRLALRSKAAAIKKRAVTYIGWMKDHASITDLIRLLRDPDPFVRKSAVSALASIKVKRSVHFLIEVLMDHDLGVRSYAFRTLRKMTGETLDYDPKNNFVRRQDTVKRLSIWWDATEEEFSFDNSSIAPPETHLFSITLTTDSELRGHKYGPERRSVSKD